MRRIVLCFLAFFLFSSHDMYLKLDDYFLQPHTESVIQLFNGTFDKSENVIDRDRMIDVSWVSSGSRTRIEDSDWFEKDSITFLKIKTENPGTYLVGLSTKARNLAMSALEFNNYLKHDGVLDMLEQRESQGLLNEDAIERYSKHVKTIFQVGDSLTDDYKTVLGYPIEFVPYQNPYDIHVGHELEVQLLYQGKPLAHQLVYVGHAPTSMTHTHDGSTHSHETGTDHQHTDLDTLRTDENGMVKIKITSEGKWYLRTIHLINSTEEMLTHESNWATLTFAIGQGHSHAHTDTHDHEEEIPSYYYILGSLAVIILLYFVFKAKK